MKLDLSSLLVLMVPAVAMADMDQFDSELFDSNLDPDDAGRGLKIDWTVDSYQEQLGQCRGATCGVWGDPHVVTCDGLAYDCQGHGLFTIMKNHMYNIQGHFVDTGIAARRMFEARNSKWRPTIINDVMIDYLESPDPDNKYPVLQFSFGNISEYDGQFISEQDCNPGHHFQPLGMPAKRGERPLRAGTIAHCRRLCEEQPGCSQFSFWANHICRLNDGKATETENPESWSRSVTGTLDSKCGTKWPLPQLLSDEEDAVRGQVGSRCPLLFHIDGELQDLSAFNPSNPGGKKWGYILGDKDSDVSVYLASGRVIKIKYTTKSGDFAEVHLRAGGHGPGELWGCHWNVYVCLPESEEDIFRAGGLGLLGTPNGNIADDWITPTGETVDIDFSALKRKAADDYCVGNWCVSQIDSIMTPTGGQTYEDVKCEHEEFIDFDIHDPGCVISADNIINSCKNAEPLLKFACEVDCCVGGCDDIEDVTNDLTDMKTLREEPSATQYGLPDHRDCDDTKFLYTGETVCPEGSGNAVKLLHSSGSMPLPEDADIIYGIELNTEPHDEITGMSVRFKVNNFLKDMAHVYVKHDKSVYDGFLDPVCETLESKVSGCDDAPQIIEAGCYNYNGITPFALVTVYIQSGEIIDDPTTEVATCCDEKPLMNSGVVKYTFEINCECPPAVIE